MEQALTEIEKLNNLVISLTLRVSVLEQTIVEKNVSTQEELIAKLNNIQNELIELVKNMSKK